MWSASSARVAVVTGAWHGAAVQSGIATMGPYPYRAPIAALVSLSVPVAAQTPAMTPVRLSPAQAVINAAEMPGGIGGVFEMVVRATGRQGGLLYLNSEADYRDPRNLTIVVRPDQERALGVRLGAAVDTAILRKVIAVRGTARKTRVDFTMDGRPTGKYYFQTQLALGSARDLTIEGERPLP